MAETKIKAAQFHGVVGHGTDGYFLMTNADGSMSWAEGGASGPSVTSVTYPGDDLAADPAGGQSVILTGTNFGSSMSVTIGGATAPSVAHDSSTQLTITTPAKAAGDYDIVVTNTVTGASGTFVNGISYNGVPTWTTATGSLGTFDSETTISTITLAATEPDGGTITFNITNGALPTGLSLTGANIDGTTTAESSTTLYSFTIEAIDDENQATPRNFSITVNSSEIVSSENFTINTYTGNGGTQSIEGKIGTSASFNGSSSYITTSNPFSGQSGSNQEYSVSLWFKADSFSNVTYPTLFKGFNSSNSAQTPPFVWTDGSIIRFHGYKYGDATVSLNTGQWYHLVVIENGDSIEIYLDGASQTLGALTTWNQVNADQIKFGADSASLASTAFDGSIDQIRIFDRALLSSEVTTLYGENNTSTTKYTTDIFDDGSGVALYEFEEGAKDTGVAIDFGQSGYFDSNNSRIENVYQIDYNTSISMWLNVDNTIPTGTYYGLWTQGDGSAAYTGIRYKRNSGDNYTIEAFIRLGNNYIYRRNTSSTWNPGWNHFVFLVNSTTGFDFYLNGNNGNFSNWFVAGTFTNVDFSNETAILGKYTDQIITFKGQMDDVRFYSDLLTSTEIGYLASNDTTNIATISNFAAHYKLDGDATDSVGSNNGTATNITYSDEVAGIYYNGTPTNVSFVGTLFQPDLVWIKERNTTTDHLLFDTIRGAGVYQRTNLASNEPSPQLATLSSFDSNGFSVGTDGGVNGNNDTYVAWCWKAGGAASLNQNGSIDSQVSANQDAGFSVVKYTANATSGATIGHGLDQELDLLIVKSTNLSQAWNVYVKDVTDTSAKYLRLNESNAIYSTSFPRFIPNNFTDSVFSVGNDNSTNGISGTDQYIAYCFHSVNGYQKIGSYTGTNAAGNFIETGFRPRFLLTKRTSVDGGGWNIFDSLRGTDKRLYPHLNAADGISNPEVATFNSNGFTFNTADSWNNGGYTYFYLAIA